MRAVMISVPYEDRGPCVPAALSVILNVTFDQINRWLVYRGYRRFREKAIAKSLAVGGTHTSNIQMSQIGMIKVTDPQMIGISINQFAQRYSQGTYLIGVSHHALAVKNGVAYDVQRDPTKKIVKEVWQKIEENKLPYDWEAAQINIQRHEQRIDSMISSKARKQKKEESYKKVKVRLKEIRKTPQYQLEQLLKRKKQWASKLKKAQTYLKKVERSIKRVEKKIQIL
jgi:hypothetical protein